MSGTSVGAAGLLKSLRHSSQEKSVDSSCSGDWTNPESGMVHRHLSFSDRKLPNDPLVDAEVMETIPKGYFREDFDAGHHELSKLTSNGSIDMHQLEMLMQQTKRQLQVVSKKISYLILENQPAYVKELARVQTLQKDLMETLDICRAGRSQLEVAKQCSTESVLELFAHYRRRCQFQAILKCLGHITTLQRTDLLIQEMLAEGDYPGAVQLCLECRQVAASYRQYTCISQLSSKLQDTLVMIEEQLDRALASMCLNFNPTLYHKIQTGFKMLGKSQSALDQLKMHYSSVIHNKSFSVVLGYVQLYEGSGAAAAAGGSSDQFTRMQYTELCSHVTTDFFTPCLSDLCKAVWHVMHSYFQMSAWHQANIALFQDSSMSESESVHVENFLQKKLIHDKSRMWSDIQAKMRTLITAVDLSGFKFDQFIEILDLANKLIDVGRTFCGSDSDDLQESLRQQSATYFKSYHRARMDELRMFLENDLWELCPIKPDFSPTDLQEFRFLHSSQNGTAIVRKQSNESVASMGGSHQTQETPISNVRDTQDENGGAMKELYFGVEAENPFLMSKQDFDGDEDILAAAEDNGGDEDEDSDDDIPEELRADFIDENTGQVVRRSSSARSRSASAKKSYHRQVLNSKSPLITNTTLIVLRFFGKYMQMMTSLKPVAFDVLICMSQLFDYYLFTVHSLFVFHDTPGKLYSNKLKSLIDRISANLILHQSSSSNGVGPSSQTSSAAVYTPAVQQAEKFPLPEPLPFTPEDAEENLFGFARRMVACESVVFLANQFEFLRSYLQANIPSSKVMFLNQFFAQTLTTCPDLRVPVYNGVASRSINYSAIIAQMAPPAVKWDIKEISSNHSPYVSLALSQFNSLNDRLIEVSHEVPLSKTAVRMLLEQCVKLTNWALIEGFSNAKKCTSEGRALMQLDFQILCQELTKVTEMQQLPDREFVDSYIKAFYLPETEFEKWLHEHREFSNKQLLAIVNCATSLHVNKKLRHKLSSIIEDSEKTTPPRRT